MRLRTLLTAKQATVGGWCGIPSAFSAELMGRSGFDWVCVDTQHGLVGFDMMASMLQGIAISGTPTFVRVPWNQPDHIMKTLDAGAQGLVIPMVNNAEEADAAVRAAKYPPRGDRSFGPTRAALDLPGYSPELANSDTVVAVMIETRDGVANLEEILAVDGVDIAYVGPNDLALGHGMPPGAPDPPEPERVQLIQWIADTCHRHGVIPGIHCASPENALERQAIGYRLFAIASDTAFLRQTAGAAAKAFHAESGAVTTVGGSIY